MTVEAIKQAIADLPENERRSLAAWLHEFDYDDWDREMAKDFSTGGRGMGLVEKVRRDVASGRAVPFDEGRTVSRR